MAGTTFQYARILPVYALYLRQCCKHLVRWWLGMLNMPCNLYGNFCTPVNVLIFEIFLYNSACSHFIDVPLCFIPLVLSEMMHPQRWVFPSNTIKQTQRFVFGYAYRKKITSLMKNSLLVSKGRERRPYGYVSEIAGQKRGYVLRGFLGNIKWTCRLVEHVEMGSGANAEEAQNEEAALFPNSRSYNMRSQHSGSHWGSFLPAS